MFPFLRLPCITEQGAQCPMWHSQQDVGRWRAVRSVRRHEILYDDEETEQISLSAERVKWILPPGLMDGAKPKRRRGRSTARHSHDEPHPRRRGASAQVSCSGVVHACGCPVEGHLAASQDWLPLAMRWQAGPDRGWGGLLLRLGPSGCHYRGTR
jgi:hypothetical protein